MPIKTDQAPNIPYLVGFTPYSVPDGTSNVDGIDDMISYDLLPSPSKTTITYDIGAESTYNTTLSIKNITQNSILQIVLTFNNNVFAITDPEDPTNNSSTIVARISPGQIKGYSIELRKSRLNSYANSERINTTIELSAKNLSNGSLVLKNLNESLLVGRLLPEFIEVK